MLTLPRDHIDMMFVFIITYQTEQEKYLPHLKVVNLVELCLSKNARNFRPWLHMFY